MDAAAYRAVNRLSAHTAWMHWLFIAVAKYGIVLFALALVNTVWRLRPDPQLLHVLPERRHL